MQFIISYCTLINGNGKNCFLHTSLEIYTTYEFINTKLAQFQKIFYRSRVKHSIWGIPLAESDIFNTFRAESLTFSIDIFRI